MFIYGGLKECIGGIKHRIGGTQTVKYSKKELNSFGRFIGDKTTFIKWVGKWKLELEKRGYHDVKKD